MLSVSFTGGAGAGGDGRSGCASAGGCGDRGRGYRAAWRPL